MGIGFGSGILLDLVLFADRIIAEPKSNYYRSILWDMKVCNDLNGVFVTIEQPLLWSSSTPSRFLTAVVSLEGDQARFG